MANPKMFTRNLATEGMTRRGFLISMSAAGAAFGFPRLSAAAIDPAVSDGSPVRASGQTFEPNLWYWIDETGQLNVNIIRSEIGQHVGTAIARILADELEVSWDAVHINHVDTDEKWGFMVTGGSWSVFQSWPIYRKAGAAGRVAFIEAAAEKWGIDPKECTARDGQVTDGSQTIGYGQLVAEGLTRSFTEEELEKLPLKPHSELRLVGKDVTALDIGNKTTGQAIYGIDAKIDGMVYAVPLLPPTRYGSRVVSIDDSAAKDQKGYLKTLALEDPSGEVPGWVVVIGKSLMAAKWASEMIDVEWEAGEAATVNEEDIQARARELIADPSTGSILHTGDHETAPAFDGAADVFEAEYSTSTVLHFQLEPVNATAFKNDTGIWEVHSGVQWQSLTLPSLAKALGVEQNEVVLRSYMVGGGFGRRLDGDYTVPAALASKALGGAPVKLVLFREDDTKFDCPRSPSVQKLRMALGDTGAPTAMEHHAAAGWPTEAMFPVYMPEGVNGAPYDPFAIEGANHWYSLGPHKVRAISNDLAIRTIRPGWLRSVGSGWTNFAVESFMDEVAHHIGADPLVFRLDHLIAEGYNAGSAPNSTGGASRQANVLKRIATICEYGREVFEEGTAVGLATSFGQERNMPTWTAAAVKVHVDKETGEVEVQKVWLVIDCGTVVDPDSARAQCEGAALWGVSMALHEGTLIEDGNVRDRNLGSYTPLRLIDTPEIEIEFIKSTEAPVGLGEPGVTVMAPAIANAIQMAVGARVRSLPITPEAVLEAM